MVCKLHEIIAFVREYKLLDDLDDTAIEEVFHSFPHCCSWDKEIHMSQADCNELGVIIDKIMEVLNENYDHEYTENKIEEIAKGFCRVFEVAGAPKSPVPFVIVVLARI